MGRCQSGHPARPRLRPGAPAPLRQFVGQQLARAAFGIRQLCAQVDLGREVDLDRGAGPPVAGNLQHGRPGQAAVGEQQVFGEGDAVLFLSGADQHRQRQAGQIRVGCPGGAVEGQRHQARAGRDHTQTELCRHAVPEIGRANLAGMDRPPVAMTTDRAPITP
jgi:hypothetical protein